MGIRTNILLLMVFLLCGCTHSVKNADGTTTQVQGQDPTLVAAEVKVIQNGVGIGVDNAFKFWYSKNPDAALEAAGAIKNNITSQVLPYLNGGQLKFGPDIMQIVDSSLFNKVNPEIKMMISLGTVVLDLAVTGPDSSKWQDTDKLNFIKAGVQGIADACDAFTANPGNPPKVKALKMK